MIGASSLVRPTAVVAIHCDRRRLSVADFPLSDTQLLEWDGICLELVDELLHSHPTGSILYVDNPNERWRYHTALVLDGLVYDAWHPRVRLPPAQYVREVFGTGILWEIDPGMLDDLRTE